MASDAKPDGAPAKPRPAKRKHITLRVPIPVRRVLRKVAYKDACSIQNFTMEGVTCMQQGYGHPMSCEIAHGARGWNARFGEEPKAAN